ncbi:hypothetical protein SDC9_211813 [bioreactor metagenome]|uniref:Uncharacterized protein n=1 Tax=bioreactor metagenome TaxID=1076179 RepID=A0A645JLA0_9ZZZZ
MQNHKNIIFCAMPVHLANFDPVWLTSQIILIRVIIRDIVIDLTACYFFIIASCGV